LLGDVVLDGNCVLSCIVWSIWENHKLMTVDKITVEIPEADVMYFKNPLHI
jgi:hypothetical protein